MIVGLLGNESIHARRVTLVLSKSENDVRLCAALGSGNSMGLPVGVVSKNLQSEPRTCCVVCAFLLQILQLFVFVTRRFAVDRSKNG